MTERELHVPRVSTHVAGLRAELSGELLLPGDAGYDEARMIWNHLHDRRPAAIVRCGDARDVLAARRFARALDLEVAVRGGGHSVPGYSTGDGVLVLDVSPMKGARVDPDRRTVRAEAGLTLGELIRATEPFGLGTTTGIVSDTGIAGLTLGGGMGWLGGMHGLTVDNLLEVELMTADGELLRANAEEHPDLFWALRGAGANFGVATASPTSSIPSSACWAAWSFTRWRGRVRCSPSTASSRTTAPTS